MNPIQPYFISTDKKFYLIKGDSLQILPELKANTVDLIFADPPYFLTESEQSPRFKGQWDMSRGFEQDFLFQDTWIKECFRLLKPDGTIWITGTHHSIYQCGFALQKNGFEIINDICWYKPSRRFIANKHNLAFSHELIIFAKKKTNKRPYMNWKTLFSSQDKFHKDGLTMPTIWDIKPCSKAEIDWHRTPKPVELLTRIIMLATKPGAVILDPFNGSGTTGIATTICGNGRIYVGIDQDKEEPIKTVSYLDETIKRYQQLKQDQSLQIATLAKAAA